MPLLIHFSTHTINSILVSTSLAERGLLPEELRDSKEENEEEDEDYPIDACNREANSQDLKFLEGKRWKDLQTAKVI